MRKDERAFEMAIDIDTPIDNVWRALTEAQELIRWFPLDAHVTPGEGGLVRWSWGEAWASEARIEKWKPPHLLRLVEESYRPFDAEGQPLADGTVQPVQIALEFTLEGELGKTRLRLVHSGFGHGASWDDEFDGISNGWQFELRSLRHYLQHHRGRDRYYGRAHTTITATQDAVWARLIGPNSFSISSYRVGDPYEVQSVSGDRFTGTVELYLPQREFSGTVSELGDGIFRLCTYGAAGQTGVTASLAAYEPTAASRVRRFEETTQELLENLAVAL